MKIICKRHPKYTGENRKRNNYCITCHLIYVLRWQHTEEAEEKLGGLNPYQFIDDVEEACLDIKILKEK